jgi:hypothetical protein
VAYAAGYIFILHESAQVYRCNVSNQQETCYQQNNMYTDNAFNWLEHIGGLDKKFARRMAMEDGEHIITAVGWKLYRCSALKPYSCTTITSQNDGHSSDHPWQTIVVGGGRIFGSFYHGDIFSFDQVTSQYKVSAPMH